MNNFDFLKSLDDELRYTIQSKVGHTNFFITGLLMTANITSIVYEELSKDGFKVKQMIIPRNY